MNINYKLGLFMIFMEYGKSRAPRFNASSGTSVASSAVADASSGIASVVASSAVGASSGIASSGTASVVASSAVVASSVASAVVARHPVVAARHSWLGEEVRKTYSMLYTNATKKLY